MSHQLKPGTVLHNRYRIESVIGQGGFGITYRALDPGLKYYVCIKELFPSGLCAREPDGQVSFHTTSGFDPFWFKKRFLREAKELARFRHPGIVRVSDVFEQNQTAYYVMDYVEGETLKSLVMRKGRLSVTEALPLMLGLMDSVEAVHKAGMLHRDIKPDNVIVEPSGSVVLIDFGSARAVDESHTIAQGAILAPGYSPLEQYSDSAEKGPFTDIYALGATCYFMLTGKKPIAAIDRKREKLIPPHQLFADVSAIWSSAVMLALELEPSDRFQRVQDFRQALLSTRKPSEPEPQPDVVPESDDAPEPRKRRRWPFLLVSAFLIVVIVIAQYREIKPGGMVDSTKSLTQAPKFPESITRLQEEMVYVPGGTFVMGCMEETDPGNCETDEKPAHKVQMDNYYIGKFEVTQDQWEALMRQNPSAFQACPNCPVEQVSWMDVQEFLRKLNEITGGQYRLPTEAEWEYAARGATWDREKKYSFAGSSFPDAVAWFQDNTNDSVGGTRPTGSKLPNKLGLFDMSGNVWEWCSDWYGAEYYGAGIDEKPAGPQTGQYRVIRGGSWKDIAKSCRVTQRNFDLPDSRRNGIGFRVVTSIK
jgi:formylglycine-generating enzyme required for sulfatase activity